jgi:uncharacterized protein (UPF0210 family)
MNILFLDIDGVLRTYKSDLYWSIRLNKPVFKGVNRLFKNKSVDYINEVILLTNSSIVISSSWRINLSIIELNRILKERGIIGKVIGKTGICNNRGDEIKDWILLNNITKYVVIDDQINDIVGIIPNDKVIKVNPKFGFSDINVNQVINILL